MATYKVIQDIEAEDKFIGPLTLKQFVFAGVAAVSGYLSFIALTKHLTFLLFFTGPVILFTGFLAWPWSRDQPTEIWALAKLRFMFKPRRRIWNQSGMQELVTITAPKREEKVVTNGLSDTEVKSRLKALANTIDSRGWAIKNVNVNLYAPPANLMADEGSDRLLGVEAIAPSQVPIIDIRADEDMLDPQNSPTAAHLNQLMNTFDKSRRTQLMDKVKQVGKKIKTGEPEAEVQPNYWFLHQNTPPAGLPKGMSTFDDSSVVLPGTASTGVAAALTSEEQDLLNKVRSASGQPSPYNAHTKVIQPLDHNGNSGTPSSVGTVTPPADPAILNLATNDDLDVATIARQAHKGQGGKSDSDDGEVVVPLR